jgi:hypothetical protein
MDRYFLQFHAPTNAVGCGKVRLPQGELSLVRDNWRDTFTKKKQPLVAIRESATELLAQCQTFSTMLVWTVVSAGEGGPRALAAQGFQEVALLRIDMTKFSPQVVALPGFATAGMR